MTAGYDGASGSESVSKQGRPSAGQGNAEFQRAERPAAVRRPPGRPKQDAPERSKPRMRTARQGRHKKSRNKKKRGGGLISGTDLGILEEAFEKGIIPKKMVETIKEMHPRLPTLYLIPKVHKNALDPPGRPIVSGNEGLCEVVTMVIDHYLKPLVGELPSYIQDTNSALRRLDNVHLNDGAIMVVADVEALYTSIRHQDGLRAVSWYLKTTNLDGDLVTLLLRLLEYVLTHNIFVFKGVVYKQCQGTAMGACCAPSYANLFLGSWERQIFVCDPIPHASLISGWMRYIDDIWFIWEGSIEELSTCMEALNQNDLNIKLTFHSGRSVEFLDLSIKVDDKGFLFTDLYRKPTSTNAFLHATSAHPPATIRGIPTGQFLRAKRICTNPKDFELQAADLSRRFQERGYSKRNIRRGYQRASMTDRNDLLYKRKPSEQSNGLNTVRFITPYHNKWHQFKEIL
ncbi:unnamed protein product [Ranitomeya imitator]|uniref:Reverse transcriptase domain-containing protein n=1 Tax=Ranitomeya imitator TaxID=111125 RepID=A0ABN9MUU0_9NEOB|nr:unnamed protein product [Ranitomeya imitator]